MATTELRARFPGLSDQKINYFRRLYESPKENGKYRTLAEVAECQGYSTPQMTDILKAVGVEITRGKRPSRLNGAEYRGKLSGRFSRVILTIPKLRDRRQKLGLSQHHIAAELGLHTCWVSNLENNMLRPTPGRIRGYADALESLDPKVQVNTRRAAGKRCAKFLDVDGGPTRPKARKPRGNSWGAFLATLSEPEYAALKAALDYRASQWRNCKGRKKSTDPSKVDAVAQEAASAVMAAIEAGYFTPPEARA